MKKLLPFLVLFAITAIAQTVSFPGGTDHVTVPFSDDHGHIVIQVGVNGTDPQPAILDTGAEGAVLNGSAETAQKYSMKDLKEDEISGAGGNGVAMKAFQARDVTFNIGGATLTGNTVMLVDRMLPGRMAQLVVGYSIFKNFVVTVDYEKSELTLNDPAKFKYAGKGTEIPLEINSHGHPFLRAAINLPDAQRVPVKLVVDTGAMHALSLYYGSAPELKEPKGEKVVYGRGASGEVRGYFETTPALILGGFTVADIPTIYPDESIGAIAKDSGQQGNLGSAILRRFKITYDYVHLRLFIEPNSHLNDPFRIMRRAPEKKPEA